MGQGGVQIDGLDEAVEGLAGRAFSFLERLVAAPSCVGEEEAAQAVVAAELERIGLDVERLPLLVPDEPAGGVPTASGEGATIVVGRRRGTGGGRSLLVNGHVDVVPPGAEELWSSPPFRPVRTGDGWLQGRGAGDMKGGIAMATLAVEALLTACPQHLAGDLAFVSVVEEECTGNGTLGSARAGVVADAVAIPEPTGLGLLLGGLGILWVEIAVHGRPTHAAVAGEAFSAVDAALPLLPALRELEAELRAQPGGERAIVNLGTVRAGDWQSSVPAVTRLGVRVGFPAGWSAERALELTREVVGRAARADPWLSEHPPRVVPNGFRAEGYEVSPDTEAVRLLAAVHREVTGEEPALEPATATTDARFYANQLGLPVFCYGPTARSIHGVDEGVQLASIVTGARVLARFAVAWSNAT